MMVGGLEGRLLAMLVGISGARRVLEIGTFTGYSAMAMAEALPDDGRIATSSSMLDTPPWRRRTSTPRRTPTASAVVVGRGAGFDRPPGGPFDLVFIDADKPGYSAYYEAVLPKLAPRGLICADNVLWSGRVLERDHPDATRRPSRPSTTWSPTTLASSA